MDDNRGATAKGFAIRDYNLLEPHWQESTTRKVQKRIIYFLLMKVTGDINGMDPVSHAMYKSQEAVDEGLRLYDVAGLDTLTSAHQERVYRQLQNKKNRTTLSNCRRRRSHIDTSRIIDICGYA